MRIQSPSVRPIRQVAALALVAVAAGCSDRSALLSDPPSAATLTKSGDQAGGVSRAVRCEVALRIGPDRYRTRSTEVQAPPGIFQGAARTVTFGFRGWAEESPDPVQMVSCEIPDTPAALQWFERLFSAGSVPDGKAAALARRADVRVVGSRNVVTFDGNVLQDRYMEQVIAPECEIYLMSVAPCEPWDDGGTWEGPAPEDPWDPDPEYSAAPDQPYFYDGEAYFYAPVIVCQGTTDSAHPSSHVRGTVNVVGRTVCSSAVPSLSVTVSLQRQSCWWFFCWWSTVSTGAPAVGSGVRVQTNAATICSSGWWRGQSRHTVSYPPGYFPWSWSGTSTSRYSTRITC